MNISSVVTQQSPQPSRQYIEALQIKAQRAIFPMEDHPLYQSVEAFEHTAFLMPKTLADFTNETDFQGDVTQLEICPTCFFQTSGTTSRSKRIPYSANDLERQKQHEAQAFRMLGMTREDVVMSLGSPLPSISGWATINGSEAVGASVANTSQLDYEDVFLRKMEQKVSFVFATPIVAREIGQRIQEDFGPLREVMPNLRTAVIFGDVLPERLRRELKDLWGFRNVVSLYGTVEADVVAVECFASPGRQHPMLERLIIEVIPESELARERATPEYQPKAINVMNAEDGVIGEIVISDLSRDILPLLRYRIGDIVKVSSAACGCGLHGPTISVLGRSKNVVYVAGVPLYEMQINAAIEAALGDAVGDWRISWSPAGAERLALYLLGDRSAIGDDELRSVIGAIQAVRPELADIDVADWVRIQVVDALSQAPIIGDAKARRIVLDR